jgi:hypothetical protein
MLEAICVVVLYSRGHRAGELLQWVTLAHWLSGNGGPEQSRGLLGH